MPTTPSLGQVALAVQNVQAMTDFYRDKVGLKFLFAAGPNLAFFDLNPTRLMLAGPESPGPKKQNSTLYLITDSVDEAFRTRSLDWQGEPHLIAKMPDHELWMVFFQDPEGNLMAFMEERR